MLPELQGLYYWLFSSLLDQSLELPGNTNLKPVLPELQGLYYWLFSSLLGQSPELPGNTILKPD